MIRKEVQKFSEDMEHKLVKNDHKSGWGNCTSSYLLLRLKEEVKELETAVRNNKSTGDVITEAADVANFAMMIADNARKGKLHE